MTIHLIFYQIEHLRPIKQTDLQLINLNNDFYSSFNDQFSKKKTSFAP